MSHSEHSKNKNCKDCKVKCSSNVGLDLDIKPKVSCHELWRKGTEFDIELDLEVDHRCKLIPKKVHKNDKGCVTSCTFGVQLDFDCHPKVRHNTCAKPSAEFELDVELDVKPECRHLKDHKSSHSKYDDKKKDHSYKSYESKRSY